MKNKKDIGKAIKKWIKDFFTKSIALKIVSLVFAMLLWGYVLMTQDPIRVKTIQNVQVTIEGEADLLARKLIINSSKKLEDVVVTVRTQLTQYADLGADDVTAAISLSGITEKGEYELSVTAKTSTGTIATVSPSKVKIAVDDLVTRRIPVEVVLAGDMPEGYWADTLSVGRTEIDIEGAAENIAGVVKAAAEIDVSNLTQSINRSVLLDLYDENGDIVSSDILLGTLPTVSVRLDVYNMKEVPIDTASALLGADNLSANYELMSAEIVEGPKTVRIVGDADVLAGIDSIALEPINVAGAKESIQQIFALVVPDGVRLLDQDTVELYIDIREKNASATFSELAIDVRGLGRKLKAAMNVNTADVVISGRYSLIALLERKDVVLYIDLTGYTTGAYQVPVYIELPTDEMTKELTKTLTVETVSVVID